MAIRCQVETIKRSNMMAILALMAMLERTYSGSHSHHHCFTSAKGTPSCGRMLSYLEAKYNLRLRVNIFKVLASAMEDTVDGEGGKAGEECLRQHLGQHLAKPSVGISAAYPCQHSQPILCSKRLQQRHPAVDSQNRSDARQHQEQEIHSHDLWSSSRRRD